MTLDRDSDEFFDEVLELIEGDPTFAARLLAAANSASSAPRHPIQSVRGALTRLGSTGASELILAIAVSRVFIPRDPWEKSLWRHALQVAGAMRALAAFTDRELGLDADVAYTAGLLHDIGRFVLFGESPDLLREVDEGDWDSPERLVEVEQAICGFTHTELGHMACEHWSLPRTIGRVALRHHEPIAGPAMGDVARLVELARFADLAMFPSALPGTPSYADAGEAAIETELIPKLPSGLAISTPVLMETIAKVSADVDDTSAALGLS